MGDATLATDATPPGNCTIRTFDATGRIETIFCREKMALGFGGSRGDPEILAGTLRCWHGAVRAPGGRGSYLYLHLPALVGVAWPPMIPSHS